MTMADCANPVEIRHLGRRDPEYVCGCGQCPTPPPTGEQMLQRVDAAWWRQMRSDDE